jgi:hypothetical protein
MAHHSSDTESLMAAIVHHTPGFESVVAIMVLVLSRLWRGGHHTSHVCKFVYQLITYYFTSCSRIFHLYGGVTITSEELQNLDLCSALRAFEQRRIFIVSHLL